MIPRIVRVVQPLRSFPRPSLRLSKLPLRSHASAQCERWYYGSRYQRFQQTKGMFQRWAARPTFYYEIGGIGAAAGGLYVYNLETVPVSGRRRFNIVSNEQEEAMAKQAFAEVMQQYGNRILPEWDRRSQMVQRVLNRLIPASGLTDQKWEVHVIESEEKNAFVIPGGKVFVFTGILPIAKDENGLATILGHEIAHNVAHHTSERLSRAFVLYAVATLLDWFIGSPGQLNQLLLQLVFFLPNGRAQETEADYIGLLMMAQSCYDPRVAPELWKRMEQAEKVAPPEFISTHPSSHNRGEKMQEWLPEALDKREISDCGSVLDYADDFRKTYGQLRW